MEVAALRLNNTQLRFHPNGFDCIDIAVDYCYHGQYSLNSRSTLSNSNYLVDSANVRITKSSDYGHLNHIGFVLADFQGT